MDPDLVFSTGFFLTLIGLIVGVPPVIGLAMALTSTGTYDRTYELTYVIAIFMVIVSVFGMYLMSRSGKMGKKPS